MNTSTLQALLKANSTNISYYEAVIALRKCRIVSCKQSSSSTKEEDLKSLRKRLSSDKKKLARLVEVQVELKEEMVFSIAAERFFDKVSKSIPTVYVNE